MTMYSEYLLRESNFCYHGKKQRPNYAIMPYPEMLVEPMRHELTRLGVDELRNVTDVDEAFGGTAGKTMVLIINSVCGCAAGMARPAISLAMQHEKQPDRYATVFAGQDMEATERARYHMAGIPPSSPFIALIKDGDVAFVIERRHIEGRSAQVIARDLTGAIDRFCGTDEMPDMPESPEIESPMHTFRSFGRY